MLILPCCVTFSNSFSTVSIHFYCDQLGCPTSCSQIDSSASGITCSCLIFPFNSSYKAFLLFLKVLFCQYCFTLNLQHFSFNVLADICCLSSSMTVLKPSAFILYFFFRQHFNFGTAIFPSSLEPIINSTSVFPQNCNILF